MHIDDYLKNPIVASPNKSPATAKVMYYLSANNKKDCQIVWRICEFKGNEAVVDIEPKIITTTPPLKAYEVDSFEIELSPNCIYQIARNDSDIKDTALGEETILEPIYVYT